MNQRPPTVVKNENPFDAKAATWDDHPQRQALTLALAAQLVQAVPLHPDFRVLEYGCGTAALSVLLVDRVKSIVAADASPGMIEQVRRKIDAAGIAHLTPCVLDLTRDAPPPGDFNLIVSAMTLHHVPDVDDLLRKLANLLAPEGWLALADLVTEDGSFHTDQVVPHPGFDPDTLAQKLSAQGLTSIRWAVAHRLSRQGRDYPVFLLVAARPQRLKVLFLCTGNSCRSQMAEGWARALKSDTIEPYSAGLESHGLNPLAVRVMAEAGIDIGNHRSKTVDAVKDVPFDYVVTVCGHAHETCPIWLSGKARVVHVGFDDPPALAHTLSSEADILSAYRRVRDEIRAFIHRLPAGLAGEP